MQTWGVSKIGEYCIFRQEILIILREHRKRVREKTMCLVLRQYSEGFKVDGLFFHTTHFFILDLVQESFWQVCSYHWVGRTWNGEVKDLTEWKTPSGNMKESKFPKSTFTVLFPLFGSWGTWSGVDCKRKQQEPRFSFWLHWCRQNTHFSIVSCLCCKIFKFPLSTTLSPTPDYQCKEIFTNIQM